MPCRTLTKEEINIRVMAYPEEIPVKGNAICSGDEDFDRQVESEILKRLEQDDVWAWATVRVTSEWECLSASEYLGCCCYADENEFREEGGYFDDMIHEALSNLNLRLRNLYERMSA